MVDVLVTLTFLLYIEIRLVSNGKDDFSSAECLHSELDDKGHAGRQKAKLPARGQKKRPITVRKWHREITRPTNLLLVRPKQMVGSFVSISWEHNLY